MKKYICIHGHFYQPPRENAWLEAIEKQDSAAPFHDWNERINYECYAPNATARILDTEKYIQQIVNNYSNISFNIGPTLMTWLEDNDPVTYQRILEADQLAQAKFNGHGSALAQVHSHLILPLANARDQYTQVYWGIRDFEFRFGRKPEGIWLSETAANTDVLEVLAEQGIKFTLLAPRQAKASRKIGEEQWQEIGIDPRRPYIYNLPSGRSIVLFFYDGNVSQGVAFEGLLNNGNAFANRLIGTLSNNDEPQLAHIATDGESYGHHHSLGEMALASCLDIIQNHEQVALTNYSQYLELFPPTHEVQIHENTSWSCVHGVERWRSNCGCNAGRGVGWTQTWRAPLRAALDWLRDEIIPIYEQEGARLLNDVWAARNGYIEVLLNKRSEESIHAFITQHATRPLEGSDRIRLLRLMEMQRQAMQMYTSCGWFFDEISDIETNQILQYANRAIYYAKQVGGIDLHDSFVERLKQAPSNVFKDGAESYLQNVVPTAVTLDRVGMHYAASALFEEKPEELPLFNYRASNKQFEKTIAGLQRFAVGRTVVRSRVTTSNKLFSFAVLYLGQQNIIGNISTEMSAEDFDKMAAESMKAFRKTNLGEVISIMQRYFADHAFSIWHLFRDEKRKILKEITDRSLEQAEASFRSIYNENYQLMLGMQQSNIPVPEAYQSVTKYVVNADLQQFFEQKTLSLNELHRLRREMKKWQIKLVDIKGFKLAASERIFKEVQRISQNGSTPEEIELLKEIIQALYKMGIELDLWKSQNLFYSAIQKHNKKEVLLSNGDWLKVYVELGQLLKVR